MSRTCSWNREPDLYKKLQLPPIIGSDSKPDRHPQGQLEPLTQFSPQQRHRVQMATVVAAGSPSCQVGDTSPVLIIYPPYHLVSLCKARHMCPWALWLQVLATHVLPFAVPVSLPPEWRGGQTQGSCFVKSGKLLSPSCLQMAVTLGKELPSLGLFFLLREGFTYCLQFLFRRCGFLRLVSWLCSYGN